MSNTLNRRQRRMQEKQKRQETVRITPYRLRQIKTQATNEAYCFSVNQMFLAVAVAMRDRCGYGQDRIYRLWEDIDKVLGHIQEDDEYMLKVAKRLKDEVGIVWVPD